MVCKREEPSAVISVLTSTTNLRLLQLALRQSLPRFPLGVEPLLDALHLVRDHTVLLRPRLGPALQAREYVR